MADPASPFEMESSAEHGWIDTDMIVMVVTKTSMSLAEAMLLRRTVGVVIPECFIFFWLASC